MSVWKGRCISRRDAVRLAAGCGIAAAGVALVGAGLGELVPDWQAELRYEDLAKETLVGAVPGDGAEPAADGGSGAEPSRDWDTLEGISPYAAGWVRVENTRVDYPVAALTDSLEDGYFLRHDIWGNVSEVGCPFLERGCTMASAHPVIYAHRLGTTGRMFSDLAATFDPDRLRAIGDCVIEARGMGALHLSPAFAMSVPKASSAVRQTDFAGAGDLRVWLDEQMSSATAVTDQAKGLIENAWRAVTLVTCSYATRRLAAWQPGSERTVTVFISDDPAAGTWATDGAQREAA